LIPTILIFGLPLWKGYQRFYEVDIPFSVTLQTWARFLDPWSRCTQRLPWLATSIRAGAFDLPSIHLGDGRLLLSSGLVAASRVAIGSAAMPKRIISPKVWEKADRLAIEAADENPDDGFDQQRRTESPFVEALGRAPADRFEHFQDGGHDGTLALGRGQGARQVSLDGEDLVQARQLPGPAGP
jgi:hypothetical protein